MDTDKEKNSFAVHGKSYSKQTPKQTNKAFEDAKLKQKGSK